MKATQICLNPTTLLEYLGIDNYHLDYDSYTVHLRPQDYSRVAEYFTKSQMSNEFEEGGWRWVCE